MTNSKIEIEYLFNQLKYESHSEQLFSFYQGCGSDICTLSIDNIDNHVYSDIDGGCKQAIFDSLLGLKNCKVLQELVQVEEGWHVTINGVLKKLYFTTNSIGEFDFNKRYGSLALVFNYNSGSSTYNRNFWRSVSTNLISQGYIIGYNGSDIRRLGRQTMFLQEQSEGYKFYDTIENIFEEDEDYNKVINFCEKGNLPTKPFGLMDAPQELITIDDNEYLVSISEFPEQMQNTEKWYCVTRLFSSKLSDYNFYFVQEKNNLTLLRKK